jgi:hypothetical protein
MVLHSRKAVALGVAVAVLSVLAGDAGASTTWRQFGYAGSAFRGDFGARAFVASNTRLNPSQLRFVAVGDGADAEWKLYCYNENNPRDRSANGVVRVRGRAVKLLPAWVDNFQRCHLFVGVADSSSVKLALQARY